MGRCAHRIGILDIVGDENVYTTIDDAEDAVRLASAARDAARAEARLARRGLTEAVIRAEPLPESILNELDKLIQAADKKASELGS